MLRNKFVSFTLLFNDAAEKGILLLAACVISLIMANTHLYGFYSELVHWQMFSAAGSTITLAHFINDGLMVLFFMLVGLEIKREMIDGNLATRSQRILPIVAAIGGVIGPVLIYCALNYHDPRALHGWAVPAATDIAFALGMFALFGRGLPVALRIFLTALAIVDDLIAVILIALFYSHSLSLSYLALMLVICIVLFVLCKMRYAKIPVYCVLGLLLWYCTIQSGIHATIAGVLLGMLIPLWDKKKRFSPIQYLEKKLHPVVLYVILPLFAFINSGVHIEHFSFAIFTNTITLGIVLGLFLGKQLGICLSLFTLNRLGIYKIEGFSPQQFYAVSVLCGIGFTMSLFVGNLAFIEYPGLLDDMKLGVISGSLISTIVGAIIMHYIKRSRAKI